jgi:AraC family transcriptional regulator
VSGSRLYAETLYTQIAIQLLWNYSSLPGEAGTQPERLADHRLRRVIDYIQDTLGDDVSLNVLADVAGLSPNYFLGAFKQATGRTPHRYVIEQRIAKACRLLHDPHSSIAEVSLAVGFSSQSHLTEAFRRFMKTTPAAYRKEVLGLVRDADDPN